MSVVVGSEVDFKRVVVGETSVYQETITVNLSECTIQVNRTYFDPTAS